MEVAWGAASGKALTILEDRKRQASALPFSIVARGDVIIDISISGR